MDSQYNPVILFAYNRPEHVKKVLDALALNSEARDTLLYIHCDGAKKDVNEEGLRKIAATRDIANNESRFKNVEVILQEHNKGLANSIIDGVSLIVNKHGKIIVLEDDTVPSIGFLRYMNEALAMYQDEKEVGCIHGWNYYLDLKDNSESTFFLKGADCWGWATWERSWKLFESDGEKLLKGIKERSLTYSFDRNGTHAFTQMLEDQINGKNDSWAIRWHASLFLKEMYCLQPTQSLITNIGLDGSGIHSGTYKTRQVPLQSIHLKKIAIEESDWFFMQYQKLLQHQVPFRARIKGQLKNIVKKILPISVRNILRRRSRSTSIIWGGDYASWEETKQFCTGYDDTLILDKVKTAIKKVRSGEYIYERDSFLFDKLQHNWPLVKLLEEIAQNYNNDLRVIDFGGSLGSTFNYVKAVLPKSIKLNWCVIEQAHFVACGKENFATDEINFFSSIDDIDCKSQDVLLLSSVLQYLDHPYQMIDIFQRKGFEHIIIDRTCIVEKGKELWTIQNVPEEIYKASYPCYFFNKKKLIDSFSNYEASDFFESSYDLPQIVNGMKCKWIGLLLTNKSKEIK